jgi:hypothetical protein
MPVLKSDLEAITALSRSALAHLDQQAQLAKLAIPEHLLRSIDEIARRDRLNEQVLAASTAARHLEDASRAYRAISDAGKVFEKVSHAAVDATLGLGGKAHDVPMLRSYDVYAKAGGLALDSALTRAADAFSHVSSGGTLVRNITRAVEAFSSTPSAFAAMQHSLTAQWSAISEHLAEQGRLVERLGPTLLDLRNLKVAARTAHTRQVRQARILADAGWPVPMEANGAEIAAAVRVARLKGAGALDRWMIRFYAANDGAALRRLRQRLEKRFSKSWFKRWATTVDDICDGIENGRFHRASLALPILDRLATRAAGINNSRMKADTWSRVPRPGGQLLVDVLWVSVGRFLDHSWAYAPFGAKRPSRSNRHWILHGYATTRRRSDALRLLLALDLASTIVVHVRRKERQAKKKSTGT